MELLDAYCAGSWQLKCQSRDQLQGGRAGEVVAAAGGGRKGEESGIFTGFS